MCLSGSAMSAIEAPTGTAPASASNAMANVGNQSVVPGEATVYVRNAFKSYGMGKHRATVLRNLAMNVKKGSM